MFSKRMSRCMVAVIVTLCLTPAVAQAGARSGERGKPRPAASRIQEREGVVLTLWHGLVSLFEKNGASIDPNGQPSPGTGNAVGTNEGASIDPSGSPQG
jgi:hypothetical protein